MQCLGSQINFSLLQYLDSQMAVLVAPGLCGTIYNFKIQEKKHLFYVTDHECQEYEVAFVPHIQGNNFSEVSKKAFREK